MRFEGPPRAAESEKEASEGEAKFRRHQEVKKGLLDRLSEGGALAGVGILALQAFDVLYAKKPPDFGMITIGVGGISVWLSKLYERISNQEK